MTFVCSATGIPTPLIQWYQGDLLLNGTGLGINSRVNLTTTVNAMRELGSVMSSLTISATMGGDSGTYICVATSVITNYTQTTQGRSDEIVKLFVQGEYMLKMLSVEQTFSVNI